MVVAALLGEVAAAEVRRDLSVRESKSPVSTASPYRGPVRYIDLNLGSEWLLWTDLLGLGLVAKSLAPGSGCGAACSDSTGSSCSENETLFLRAVFLFGCSASCAAPSAGVASARRGDESRFKRAGEADDGSAALEADAVVLGRDERLGI